MVLARQRNSLTLDMYQIVLDSLGYRGSLLGPVMTANY